MTEYNQKCPVCGSPARPEEITDHENDRSETYLFCVNVSCTEFDTKELGPAKLVEFIKLTQSQSYHIQQLQLGQPQLEKLADEISRMGIKKLEVLEDTQEVSG
jgi:hypothetical protein